MSPGHNFYLHILGYIFCTIAYILHTQKLKQKTITSVNGVPMGIICLVTPKKIFSRAREILLVIALNRNMSKGIRLDLLFIF